jgi:mediator of RNA polymerase II transcription subunit 6
MEGIEALSKVEATAESLAHTVWSDPQWLAQNRITRENVLSYFSRSPFYDRSCNNELIRMQITPELQGGDLNFTPREEELLQGMQGLEFVPELSGVSGDLVIIRRQVRFSAVDVRVEKVYYTLYGNVYESPLFVNVLLMRLLQSTGFLLRSLVELSNRGTSPIAPGEEAQSASAGDELTLQLLLQAQSNR